MKLSDCPPGCYPDQERLGLEIKALEKSIAQKRDRIVEISKEMYKLEKTLERFDRTYTESNAPSKWFNYGVGALVIGSLVTGAVLYLVGD